MNAFELLKGELAKATIDAVEAVDEDIPFVVKCDTSDVAVSGIQNQGGHPWHFICKLTVSERNYLTTEKEATAYVEAVRKWRHWLLRQHFVLITDQRSFIYFIRYHPGPRNVRPNSFTGGFCSAMSPSILSNIHDDLCHPGV